VMRLLVPDALPDRVRLDRKRQTADAAEVIDRPVKSAQNFLAARAPTSSRRHLTYPRTDTRSRSKCSTFGPVSFLHPLSRSSFEWCRCTPTDWVRVAQAHVASEGVSEEALDDLDAHLTGSAEARGAPGPKYEE